MQEQCEGQPEKNPVPCFESCVRMVKPSKVLPCMPSHWMWAGMYATFTPCFTVGAANRPLLILISPFFFIFEALLSFPLFYYFLYFRYVSTCFQECSERRVIGIKAGTPKIAPSFFFTEKNFTENNACFNYARYHLVKSKLLKKWSFLQQTACAAVVAWGFSIKFCCLKACSSRKLTFQDRA